MSPSAHFTISLERRCEAFALVLVMIALALIVATTVFFLSNVGRERRGVDQYSRGSEVRHLADTAVNLVMGQINAATKEGTASTPVSWASQPGMIRTYGTNGGLSRAYKLYSWDNLVEPGPMGTPVSNSPNFDPTAASEYPDAQWSSHPSQYTDLNAPANGLYPIVDPTIANDASGNALVTGSAVPAWDFPTAFSVATGAQGYYPLSAATGKLPMPVKWIYVLQDGSWVTPTAVTGNTASFSGVGAALQPTSTNPIVGRIAFWTDDETSKVNVNTASEGSFWDTPKAATQDDMQFAGNPPARGEFQRISGHPATTSLSAVFPEMRTGGFNRWNSTGSGINTLYAQELQDLLKLSPRINWGGSQAGTYPITSYNQTYAPVVFSFTNSSVTLDSDRLYASADDLWFQPDRTANTAFGNIPSPGTPITAQTLAKRIFLFTANSRAPETTLFETPRISLWPITWPYATSAYYVSAISGPRRTTPLAPATPITPDPTNIANNPWMTYQERLLAFDSTLKGSTAPLPFYFQRQNPDSPVFDWTNIQRNQDLVGYLSREMRQPIPGTGNSLSLNSKFGNTTGDWIALNCFDFSRSLINQYTYNQTQTPGPGYTAGSDYQYTYTGIQTASGNLNNALGKHVEPNAYSVVPLHVPLNGNTYTTEGAFPALKEACLVFYAKARNEPSPPLLPAVPPNSPQPDPTKLPDPKNWQNLITFGTGGAGNGDQSQTTKMQAVMLLSFSGMAPGVYSSRGITYFSPVFWVKITRVAGEGSFQVDGNDINFPDSTDNGNVIQYSTVTGWTGGYMASMPASLFSTIGVTKTFKNKAESPATWNTAGNWSLISDDITTVGTNTTFQFKGTKIQVDIYACLNGDVNADPTAGKLHPELLISSQQIDFGGWSYPGTTAPPPSAVARTTPLPIPLAPRWNVKQTPSVKMPSTSSTYNTAAVMGWQTEIVPLIGLLGNTTVNGSTDPRGPSYTLLPVPPAASNEPLIYAYTDNSSAPMSRDFQTRVNAFKGSVSNLSEGSGAPLFSGYSQPGDPIQAYQLITPYDTAISMVSDPTLNGTAGDARLMGRGNNTSSGNAGATTFYPYDWALQKAGMATARPLSVVNNTGMYQRATDKAQYHSLSTIAGQRFPTGYWLGYQFGDSPNPAPTYKELGSYGSYTQTSSFPASDGFLLGRAAGDAAVGVDTNVTNTINAVWDWTALPGNFEDGGYIARPDQDYQIMSPGSYGGMRVPYYNDNGFASTSATGNLSLNVFMPNRQVPSPVILGTLPSSMTTGWQTLAFSPNPAKAMNSTTSGAHPGLGTKLAPSATGAIYSVLPDHPLLDLFWMPVAEPYPISDGLSTAGKVNLNYAMMPFPYIQRKTGLDAVLKSVSLAALPSPILSANFAKYYKSYALLYKNGRLDATHTRFPVNVDATLQAFDYKFNKGDIFRSTSQICEMFLYPNDPAATDQLPSSALVRDNNAATTGATTAIASWWATKSLTADNVREDPYSAIYSRVTTKSNTFTVHWKVQSLRKSQSTSATNWTEKVDSVTSELRGSTLIERYIDPNASLPDYATDTTQSALPLSNFYKWRTVSESYFQP